MTGRKSVFGILIILALLLAGLFWYLQDQKQQEATDPYGLVPMNALAMLEVHDVEGTLSGILHNNRFLQEMQEISGFQSLFNSLEAMDSLFARQPVNRLMETGLVVSFHVVGKEQVDYLGVCGLSREMRQKEVSDYLERAFGSSGEERMYDQTAISRYEGMNGVRPFYVAFRKGMLLVSTHIVLLEQALRQLDDPGFFAHDASFLRLRSTAGKSNNVNIYFHLEGLSGLFAPSLSDRSKERLKRLSHFGDWLEADIDPGDHRIAFNGFFSSGSGEDLLLDLAPHTASELTIDRMIPANSWFTQTLILSESDPLVKSGGMKESESFTGAVFLSGTEQQEVFMKLLDGQMAVARTDYSNLSDEENCFYIFSTKSRSEVEEFMINRRHEMSEAVGSDPGQSDYRIDDETVFRIYEIPETFIAAHLAGDFFYQSPSRYFTFWNNYLVFSGSREALSKYLHNIELQKTLATDLDYTEFKENLPSRSNYYLYFSLPKAFSRLPEMIDPGMWRWVLAEEEKVRKIQAFGLSLTARDPMPYLSASVVYKPDIREDAETIWESMLDTACRFKPYLFENHYTHNYEIFVQDLNHQIYLLNASGRIMWQVPLEEEIVGEVHTVDIYGNGKYQLLFATKSRIHLIDRNGNYVERFPVTLRSPASTGLSAFDYEGNYDYRFCIAGTNRKVYMYDKEGNTVSGWGTPSTEKLPSGPVLHYRISGKDYLVTADENRIYIWDRRGNLRVEAEGKTGMAPGSEMKLSMHGTPCIIYSGPEGTVRKVFFNGTVENISLRSFSPGHHFTAADLNADGAFDFVFTDKDKLYAFNEKERIFSYRFDHTLDLPPQVYTFSGKDVRIGVVDASESRIYLINKDGQPGKGFPQPGTYLFSIGNLSRRSETYNLLVPGRGNFLYNYIVY